MERIMKRLQRVNSKSTAKAMKLRRVMILAGVVMISAGFVTRMWAWGSTSHAFIIDAALTALPSEDKLSVRLGGEARHLRQTVQMGDWMNSLIIMREDWHVTQDNFPQVTGEYYGNDYLLVPEAPRFFHHDLPDVKGTYRPYFFRALQALRTEDRENAVRWMGSLLHFVTDSGSPPHTISLHTNAHQKMENWLDASKIDLRGYHPVLLGNTEEEAESGLERRMSALITRDAVIAQRMVPLADANNRAALEPMAMDCARETAMVAADVIHTLLVLSSHDDPRNDAALDVSLLTPALPEHPTLPAKLVLLGTNYSTMSEADSAVANVYAGSFDLHHLPPGTYHAAVERQGASTYFSEPIVLHAGEHASFHWSLQAGRPEKDLAPNADFALHWVDSKSPDHWRYDEPHKGWISDNIPVTAGNTYTASVLRQKGTHAKVEMEWMAQHWLATTDSRVELGDAGPQKITVPDKAVYVRFVIAGETPPQTSIQRAVLIPVETSTSLSYLKRSPLPGR